MKILSRYISIIFIKNFFLSVMGLGSLFFFQAVLAKVLEGDFPISQILAYYCLQIPSIVVQMSPPSVLMGTVLTLSTLSRTNELTACFSIGVGLRQLMLVLISLVFMVCCLLLVLQDRIAPPFFKKQTNYYWRVMKEKPDFYLDFRQDKIWYRSQNLIYNLKTFDAATKTIDGMSVYTMDEKFNLIQFIEASKAKFNDNKWELENGAVTVFSEEDHFPLTRQFEKKELRIAEKPHDFQEIEREVEGLRLKELYRYIERSRAAGADTKAVEVHFHSRISLSFIPLVMAFLAIPFSIRSNREGGMAKDLSICFGITVVYWLFYSVGLALGSKGSIPPLVAAWLPSVIFAALAGGSVYWKGKK